MSLHPFEGIIYINLDHRKDREELFLKEMDRLQVSAARLHRISGHYDPLNGVRGCVISHIAALELALEKGWNKALILEDDCFFIGDLFSLEKQCFDFFRLAEEAWDVFLMGGMYLNREECEWPGFVRICNSMRAHAYCVHSSYISILLKHFKVTLGKLQKQPFFYHSIPLALDRSWRDLQAVDRWYAPRKPVAFQTESFSDIELFDKEARFE